LLAELTSIDEILPFSTQQALRLAHKLVQTMHSARLLRSLVANATVDAISRTQGTAVLQMTVLMVSHKAELRSIR
jgi:hypothetical protein